MLRGGCLILIKRYSIKKPAIECTLTHTHAYRCLDCMRNPVDLACGNEHKTCAKCLYNFLGSSIANGDLTCPQCRKKLTPQKPGFEKLSIQERQRKASEYFPIGLFVKRLIGTMKAKCTNECKDGICDWKGQFFLFLFFCFSFVLYFFKLRFSVRDLRIF